MRKSFSEGTNFERYFDIGEDLKEYLLESLIFFSPIINFIYYFISDLLMILGKIKLEKNIKKDKQFKVYLKNPHIMKDLTTVSNIFLSKNCLMDSQIAQINHLVLEDKYVELNDVELGKIRTYFDQKKENMFAGEL